jgi:signal transduction histidine kinase
VDKRPTRVLLIEDDEDDYRLVKDLLAETGRESYTIDWESSYDRGLDALCGDHYDVLLLDYRLGARTGLELLRDAAEKGCAAPVIFLTGQGDYDVDVEAMKGGAVDFLVKAEISARLLERSIRYAIERKRTQDALRESERLLKRLSSELLKAQETERKRIAQDLHEGIAQYVAAAKVGLESALSQMSDKAGDHARKSLKTVVSALQKAVGELGRISGDLWPSTLEDFGVLITIDRLFREFDTNHPGIRIQREIDISENDLSEPVKIGIYRITREAIHNITEHTRADRILFSLKKTDGRIELAIGDNGAGLDLTAALLSTDGRRGLEFSAMRERAELSGGLFSVESEMRQGTVIRVSWPVPEQKIL